MPKRRAQITRESAGEMYGDVIDRVTARAAEPAARPALEPEEPGKPPLVKVTVYLTPEDVLAIDKMVSDEFRLTGRRPRRSTVVSRGIQLLAETVSDGGLRGAR
jgi:hypothetical protein